MEYTKEKYTKELEAYRLLKEMGEFSNYGQGYFEALERVEDLILK